MSEKLSLLKRDNANPKVGIKKSRLQKKITAVKKKIKYSSEVIAAEKFKIYTYKMFSDAVAFLYIEVNIQLNSCIYNVHNYNIKKETSEI
ncbi:hypothetical protein HZC92_23440 [Klebsiella pneumoniae]|uniref:hypothetical protein n=1 Tax=Klebsiella pneumoniae TaxID=573 RepID=UPI001EFD566F|nr:hypothetical protein [Klebsiella pneumoniae]MCG8978620.1 hypothetical protein [Klebsiella pneumoniae]